MLTGIMISLHFLATAGIEKAKTQSISLYNVEDTVGSAISNRSCGCRSRIKISYRYNYLAKHTQELK